MNAAEKKVDDVKSSIIVKFDNISDTASQYWSIRDRIMDCECDRGFNEYAFQQDRHHSGRQEAWEQFGLKWGNLELELEELKSNYGSVEKAFLEKKRALLVDTDAILNTAFQLLREISGAKSVDDVGFGGRRVYGLPIAYYGAEAGQEIPSVPVKNLIWYGRHQANHYSDIPGPAVARLTEYKMIFISNIDQLISRHHSFDLVNYFLPDSKISMSDEIIRLLGWRSFDEFRSDLLLPVSQN